MNHITVNRIKVHAPSSRNDLIDFALENRSILVAVNAEKILHASEQSRRIINRNVGYPDGFGAILAIKKQGLYDVVKIPGCELWLDIIHKHYLDKRFYLIGGKEAVIQQTVKKLKDNFEGINIVNYRNGYLKDNLDMEELIADISHLKPDIVFVAMGSPIQEVLMEKMHNIHPALYQGLGGSFDVYTGKVKRASPWFVKNNLEWLYRLIQEPSRIKRQVYLIKFLILLNFGFLNKI